MKKLVKTGIAMAMSCAVFAGCQSGDNAVSSDTQSTEANSSEDSQTQAESGTITICVDSVFQENIRNAVEAWEKLNDGAKAEIVVIPSDETSAETKITSLRTEIMSGEGPDVFVLWCSESSYESSPLLFDNPEKAMYSDTFLALDACIEQAQYMHTSEWNQPILKSGKTGEGQMVIPIAYDYYAYSCPTADLGSVEHLPASWEELLAFDEAAIKSLSQFGMNEHFYASLGDVVDYENETILLSEDALLEHVKQAKSYCEEAQQTESTSESAMCAIVYNKLNDLNSEETIFALPNTDGGVTAAVTAYAAVNRNTENKEAAFSFLDVLLSDECMSGTGFEIAERHYGTQARLDLLAGISVNDAILAQQSLIAADDVARIQAMSERINAVCYGREIADELNDLHLKSLDASDAEIEELVDEAYQSIQMKLSE